MNELFIAFIAGVGIFAFWVLAYFSCWIGQWIWAWVDDSEICKRNILIDKIMFYRGYRLRNSVVFPYRHKKTEDDTDGFSNFLLASLTTSTFPLLALLSVVFYSVSLFIICLMVIVYIARLARRQKKALDSHLENHTRKAQRIDCVSAKR